MRLGTAAVAAALLLSAVGAAAADALPQPPYFSVQLGTAASRNQALARLQSVKDVPHVRAERRRSGWQLRAGAWSDRAQAEAALRALRAEGFTNARVLQMETTVPWLLADGTTVTPDAGAGPSAAASATAAPRTAAPAAPPAPGAEPIPAPPIPPAPPVATNLDISPELRTAADALDAEVRRWLATDGAARRDRYVYGMDMAPLLLYAAQRADAALYLQILPAARKLIADDPRNPFTRGMVLWRQRDGYLPELSGATEALWMARALWTGAATFKRGADRALALAVLEAYARHAYELEGTWIIRKYFAFSGASFSSLSNITNYHADFLADVEREVPRADWRGFAERSYGILDHARAPSGLLYPLIQPEVGAAYPQLKVTVYAPNGFVSLSESCAGAEGALRGDPRLADGVLRFAGDRDHANRAGRLFSFYRAADGEPVGHFEMSSNGYACLTRLAAARDDRRVFARLAPRLLESMQNLTHVPSLEMAPYHEGAQLLLAAYAAGMFNR